MSSRDINIQLPTLPPEVIARILSLGAEEARVGAGPRVPISPFLRQLSLLSHAWYELGQAELVPEVSIWCEGEPWVGLGSGSDPLRLLVGVLISRPERAQCVRRLFVAGDGSGSAVGWTALLRLCPNLESLACYCTSICLNDLSQCQRLKEVVLRESSLHCRGPLCVRSVRRLTVDECIANSSGDGWLEPGAFPSLETLVLLDTTSPPCLALAAAPTLRALVISVLDHAEAGHPIGLKSGNVLCDVWPSDLGSLALWADRFGPPVHVGVPWGPGLESFARRVETDELLSQVKTVYVWKLEGPSPDGDEAGLAALKEVARAKKIAVIVEGWHARDEFGFDHFIKHHSRKGGAAANSTRR